MDQSGYAPPPPHAQQGANPTQPYYPPPPQIVEPGQSQPYHDATQQQQQYSAEQSHQPMMSGAGPVQNYEQSSATQWQHQPPPPQSQSGMPPTQQYAPPPIQGGQSTAQSYPPPPQQAQNSVLPTQQYHSPPNQSYPPPPQVHEPGQAQPYIASNLYTSPPDQAYHQIAPNAGQTSQYNASSFPPPPQRQHEGEYVPPLPPRRVSQQTVFGDDDPSNPIHYTRDPHKLVAYLVPFPKPQLKGIDPSRIPDRFLIYTPPPPPLQKPVGTDKEGKLHKVQRKWEEEVRTAKTSDAKTASWKGVKSKATRGISTAMQYTTSSNLDFLGRLSTGNKSDTSISDGGHSSGEEDPAHPGTTHKTVGVTEMVLIYPPTMSESQEQLRAEFVNTMLRTKTKAQKDAVISTGLIPVAFAIDVLATLVWPFGGLAEIDTVWAYANIRGVKTARSVTKRLSSSSDSGNHEQDKLKLTFTPSQRLELLRTYLAHDCLKTDARVFAHATSGGQLAPTETQVLEALGWSPHGESKNWEDEQWETREVKDDLKTVMHKGAREWSKWCKAYEKDPEKAMKK